MAIEVTAPALLAQLGLGVYNKAQLGRTTPSEMPSNSAAQLALATAANERAKKFNPDGGDLKLSVNEYRPQAGEKLDTRKAASVSNARLKDGSAAHSININPNADRSYFAHELGHVVSQQTKVGDFVNKAKHFGRRNPKLAQALMYALPAGLAGTTAALEAGDDDLDSSLAIAALAASPTLVDEALASKNALAIMDDAGMRATAGQRGRLAGAYLSYLAPVIIGGSVANAVGNVADDYTALYDLSSPGEISP